MSDVTSKCPPRMSVERYKTRSSTPRIKRMKQPECENRWPRMVHICALVLYGLLMLFAILVASGAFATVDNSQWSKFLFGNVSVSYDYGSALPVPALYTNLHPGGSDDQWSVAIFAIVFFLLMVVEFFFTNEDWGIWRGIIHAWGLAMAATFILPMIGTIDTLSVISIFTSVFVFALMINVGDFLICAYPETVERLGLYWVMSGATVIILFYITVALIWKIWEFMDASGEVPAAPIVAVIILIVFLFLIWVIQMVRVYYSTMKNLVLYTMFNRISYAVIITLLLMVILTTAFVE